MKKGVLIGGLETRVRALTNNTRRENMFLRIECPTSPLDLALKRTKIGVMHFLNRNLSKDIEL